jgi:hypothetical protein
VFRDIAPRNGVIDIRFSGGDAEHGVPGEAFVQAIELGPEIGGQTATPVCLLGRNLLRDGGFEGSLPEAGGSPPAKIGAWQFLPLGVGSMRVDRESAAKTGGAAGHGLQTVRISGKGQSRLVQEVAVRPEAPTGLGLVLARDENGSGLGRSSSDRQV